MPGRAPRPQRVLDPRDERELDRIRTALAEDVRRRSLRAVAQEVGMRPSGLKNVLGGTVPYAPTLAKVRAWYLRWRDGAGVAADDVDQRLQQLLRWLPQPGDGMPAVLDTIASVHQEAGVTPPPWFTELRSRYPVLHGSPP